MRSGRFAVVALLTVLALEGVASAAGPNADPTGSSSTLNERTPTAGPWERKHEAKEIYSRNTDPVIAVRENGKYYDAREQDSRTRGTINKQDAADAQQRSGFYNRQNMVTGVSGDKELWNEAVKKGKAGEYDKKTGNGAEIEGCVLCTKGEMKGQAGITKDGVQATGSIEAGAYLARVEGQAGARYNGEYGSAGVGAKGEAFVGAQVKGSGTVGITKERIVLNGKVEAFAGGKAEGEVSGQVGLTNIGTAKGTLKGEVSYGIGASAEGYFTIDWKTWSFKAGGKVSATLGIGAGVGFQTEVSIKPAVDWTVNKVKQGAAAVANGVSRAGSAIASTASSIASSLCFWCKAPAPSAPMPPQQQINTGNQATLNSSTGSAAIAAATGAQGTPPAGGASSASGAGMAGALGR